MIYDEWDPEEHSGVRETSKEAYFDKLESGNLGKQQAKIWRALHRFGPATCIELHAKMFEEKCWPAGYQHVIASRLTELRQSGWAHELGNRESRVGSRKNAIIFKANLVQGEKEEVKRESVTRKELIEIIWKQHALLKRCERRFEILKQNEAVEILHVMMQAYTPQLEILMRKSPPKN